MIHYGFYMINTIKEEFTAIVFIIRDSLRQRFPNSKVIAYFFPYPEDSPLGDPLQY